MHAEMTSFFEAVTWTGAGIVLAPLALMLSAGLWLAHRRHEAVVLAASMASAWLLIYAIKALVDQSRPALWCTAWYWGSSFPSGHTVNTAAFAGAQAIGVARLWPKWRATAIALAAVWISLVALSRLVLGMYWPTDVLASICLGLVIPLAISALIDLCKPNWVNIRAA
jgi:undecaprenyl-diphosphatase